MPVLAAFPFLLLLATGASSPPVVLDRIAAVIGDELLLASDIDRYAAIGIVERRSGESEEVYRERILGERVVELLRERELRKTAGFTPEAADVDARYRALSERISKERGVPFETILATAGVSREEALDWMKKGMAIQLFIAERLLPSIRVSDEEMASFYNGPFQVEANAKGQTEMPPLRQVEDEVRALLKERKLNAEVERWTDELRKKTRIVIYRRALSGP
jgi:parvulin-like peptidyl-prolyl isomerase